MTKITVIVKEISKKLETKEVENDMNDLLQLVGGDLELIHLPHNIDLWTKENEDIDIRVEHESNFLKLRDHDSILPKSGSVFFAGRDDQGWPISLTDFQQEWIKDQVVLFHYAVNIEVNELEHNFEII